MNYGQVHRLGKCLIELSGVVAGAPGDNLLALGEAAVLEDAMEHPGTSIREVHQRSGFTQSHVSASVARLKERGLLTTLGDPPAGWSASAWRARTRLQATDDAQTAVSRRRARRVTEASLRAAVGPAQAKRAIRLMEELAEILL
jgi:DNA-binding MarR family transcriptional regulator